MEHDDSQRPDANGLYSTPPRPGGDVLVQRRMFTVPEVRYAVVHFDPRQHPCPFGALAVILLSEREPGVRPWESRLWQAIRRVTDNYDGHVRVENRAGLLCARNP